MSFRLCGDHIRGCGCAICAPYPEQVDHPAHYGGDTPYEVIKVAEAWSEMFGLSFRVLQVIKYLTRAGHKPGTSAKSDLLKARWYLDREISKRFPDTPPPTGKAPATDGHEVGCIRHTGDHGCTCSMPYPECGRPVWNDGIV